MSTNITTIYNALGSLVAGVLTTYKRIPNPYFAAANNSLYLSKGYGIAIGVGQHEDISIGRQRGFSRTFTLILVNQVTTTDHDLTGRENLEKGIVEDFIAVHKAVEGTTLGGAIDNDYIDDSGVNFLASDDGKFKYLTMTVNFRVIYEETLP